MKCLCNECTVKGCERKKNLSKRIQGKKNRNTGRYAEQKLKKVFESWGVKAQPTVASGSLKQVTERVKSQKYLFSGDFYLEGLIPKQRLKVECKKRQFNLFKKYYELTEGSAVIIEDFCVLISQRDLNKLLTNKAAFHGNYTTVVDSKYKLLHDFFNQDNADIVAMTAKFPDENRYMEFIFAIQINVFKKMIK